MLAIINAELVMKDHLIPEAVLFVEDGEGGAVGETEYKLAQTIAAFLGKHMES